MIERDRPPDLAQDRTVDRRAFLARLGALTAAASGATLAEPLRPHDDGGPAHRALAQQPPAPHSEPERAAGPAYSDLHPSAYAQEIRPEALADPVELTIAEAATLIRRRELSPLELVDAYLARISELDTLYQAFNLVLTDAARAQARRTARGRHRGPLTGIPLAIKDNFYTAGVPTTANSDIFADFVPAYDATVVARLHESGAIVLGKTQMGPLATTRATTPTGDVTTLNAWAPADPSVSPGGSSSGSATAVAGRLATSSIGTQTGGSITVPALAQGLTGLKPTFGRVSLHGVIPLSYTRDHPGPIARDARDAAIMLQVMAGPDRRDPRTLGLPPVPDFVRGTAPVQRRGRPVIRWRTRIGLLPDYGDVDDDRAAARHAMLTTFEELGAELVEVDLPRDWDVLTGRAFNAVRLPERTEAFLHYLKQDVRLFGVSLPAWINGLLLGGDEYIKGQRARLLLLQRTLDGLFERCDVVLLSSHLPFDMIGLPLIAFPIGMHPERERPIGALFGGLPFAEDRLLSMVGAYQAVTDWHLARPPEPVGVTLGSRLGRGRIRTEEMMDLSE